MRLPRIPKRFFPLIVVFALLVVFMPRTAKFAYDYRKGSPWAYETLIAQFDFPILKTEDQIEKEREKSGSDVVPYYRKSEETTNTVLKNVEALDFGRQTSVRPYVVSRLRDIYEVGVISDSKLKVDRGSFSISEEVLFIQSGKRVQKYPRTEVYRVSDAQGKLMSLLSASHPGLNADSLLRSAGVYEVIVPNLTFDKTMTELSHTGAARSISPTIGYVNADQKIVSKGEIVTAEIAQILDSYKEEYNKSYGYDGPRILIWLGNILIAAALVVLLYFVIQSTNKAIFEDRNRYIYLLTVFLIAALSTFVVVRVNAGAVYVIPYTVTALFLLAFFRRSVVLPVYIVSLLPLLVFSNNGVELFVMFLTAGTVSIFTFGFFDHGWRQFLNAFLVFVILALVFCGFRLLDSGGSKVLDPLLQLFLGSMLTVAFYPLIYLFEKIFNLVSTTRLEELCDTNNPLLQELSAKAPGTFQHSLQVMNLCDAAARSIDANVPLIRAGALYHDIGKMKNPLCFVENTSGAAGSEQYHEGLTPKQSAHDIISHVSDGVEIAEQHKLPAVIRDFILTHHGTTMTGYFYNRYLNEGGDPSDVSEFFYDGKKPSTKEQIILMLCDTLEAASRTLKENTPEAFDKFVEDIVSSKMKQGQFDEADITVRELGTVKRVLKEYLRQIYHERIEYPKLKKKVNKQN